MFQKPDRDVLMMNRIDTEFPRSLYDYEERIWFYDMDFWPWKQLKTKFEWNNDLAISSSVLNFKMVFLKEKTSPVLARN